MGKERLPAGQPVQIRENLEVGRNYGGLLFVAKMEPYRGKNTKVIYVYEDSYDLEIDGGKHGWTDPMLQKNEVSSNPS